MDRAIARTGTGDTTALATTQIGALLELPAGGPHLIHSLWAQVAKVSTVPNEGTGGDLIVTTVSGDIEPQPAPAVFPIIGSVVSESANANISVVPLNLWAVDWTALGKATLTLSYRNELAITTGSIVAAGIIFGDNRPVAVPAKFCQVVRASFASATEQTIGTIELAEKAQKITGIMAVARKGDTPTAGEAVMVTIRLASDDIMLPPSQYPCAFAYNASDGTAVGAASMPPAQFIPVDIPVIGGARVDIFATSTVSVTGNVDVSVYLQYE